MRKEQLTEFEALLKAIPILFCRYYLNLAVIVLLMFVSRNASLNAADASSNFSSSAGIQVSPDPNPEQAILVAVNRLRAEKGLSELKFSEPARQTAREQSTAMAQHRYLAHRDFLGRDLKERLTSNPSLHFRAAGENIARNKGFSNPATQAVDGWVNSPGHLANMLDTRFTETGVGIAVDSEGTFYFTQIFLSK
jgi:uncharacterized protein YkwD